MGVGDLANYHFPALGSNRGFSAAEGQAAITSIRGDESRAPDRSRIVLDLDKSVDFKEFTLTQVVK